MACRRASGSAAHGSTLRHSFSLSLHRNHGRTSMRRPRPAPLQVSLGGAEAGLEPRDAWLLWGGALHAWSHCGYGARRSVASMIRAPVEVLTPASTAAVLKRPATLPPWQRRGCDGPAGVEAEFWRGAA